MRETKNLEFKEKLTNTFLKTVSAFANYGSGKIKFGIKDDGSIVGVKNPVEFCLNVENKINDSIKPNPDYNLEIDPKTNVVTLIVKQGINPPRVVLVICFESMHAIGHVGSQNRQI